MKNTLFIIAGERRSGTSALAKWIEIHPEIYFYPLLDQSYFVEPVLRGRKDWMDGNVDSESWVRQHSRSDYLKLFANRPREVLAYGEKSADLFFWPPCLNRIKELVPEARIIITLRNPVDRAWSHYWNEVGKGREALSFEEALEAEPLRSQQSDYARYHLSYYERGKYAQPLRRWLKNYPGDQFMVQVFEDLIANPKEEMTRIYKFLGVDPKKGLEMAGQRINHNWTTVPYDFWKAHPLLERGENVINRGVKGLTRVILKDPYKRRKYGREFERITRKTKDQLKMSEATRNRLLDYYAPHTSEVEEILKRPLDVWKK